jgi:hypothetical protein
MLILIIRPYRVVSVKDGLLSMGRSSPENGSDRDSKVDTMPRRDVKRQSNDIKICTYIYKYIILLVMLLGLYPV